MDLFYLILLKLIQLLLLDVHVELLMPMLRFRFCTIGSKITPIEWKDTIIFNQKRYAIYQWIVFYCIEINKCNFSKFFLIDYQIYHFVLFVVHSPPNKSAITDNKLHTEPRLTLYVIIWPLLVCMRIINKKKCHVFIILWI